MADRVAVTGGAGFIGSNLVDSLVDERIEVVVLDNFSTGKGEFLARSRQRADVREVDLLQVGHSELVEHFSGVDTVYHLAANADVRFGWDEPFRDVEQNLMVTLKILSAAEEAGVKDIVFSSTGSVYGEAEVVPTPEDCPFPRQTSLYGASKASAENFIDAHVEAGRIRATIFRFVSVLGPRYSHGHVFDFFKQLRADPAKLTILGDGAQRKSYMHVNDCVRALMTLRGNRPSEVFNLGANGFVTVIESATWIAQELGVTPSISFTGGDRGWIGDNPFIYLDVSKAAKNGWRTTMSIEDAVRDTVRWLGENEWIFDVR